MLIFSVLLLLAAGLFLLPPGTGAAGFVGPGVSPTLTRAADVLNAWDDAPCVLEGHILEKIPRKDRYLFEDESGRVVVEIEHETFGHLTVTPQDKVRLVGHVDWSSKHPNEVEVDALAIIQCCSGPAGPFGRRSMRRVFHSSGGARRPVLFCGGAHGACLCPAGGR